METGKATTTNAATARFRHRRSQGGGLAPPFQSTDLKNLWNPHLKYYLTQSRRLSSRLRRAKRLSGGGGGAKFEIKHKSLRCLQKGKLVKWKGQACGLRGTGPLGAGPDVTCIVFL